MRQEEKIQSSEVLALFHHQAFEVAVRVDRAFAILMAVQWFVIILVALFVSPNVWNWGPEAAHNNFLLALVLGGLLSLPTIFCTVAFPGRIGTRYVTGIAQMCFSTLFIHLTGGRIETHFHVFVSLVFLAFYKDVALLWIGALIVILFDDITREYFFPLIFRSEIALTHWHWLEHASWIVFECLVLSVAIVRINQGLLDTAESKHQLIQAREHALKAASLKSNFLSNMSHEIRTPLNSIIGFSDILKDTKLDEEQAYYVGTIHRCSDTLLHLINDILDFSKIENGLMQVERHRFDVQELHHDLQRMFMVICREKGLELSVKIDESVPRHALGDSYRLRQVLTNLLSNAIKFTPKGRVDLCVGIQDGKLCWQVKDTGIGIQKENIPHLFKHFTQADSTITRRFGGTGLGLMISKNLIELMGGKISVESEVGAGTTFSFAVPFEEA
ncbi:sensor histidine kinase [Bdellovibrio sp. HCB2-146]|uniref:sensor histidine kinase n=1 Tax=Bdellovibrio sp. HCB2-146 TaxID=3394362 RepID=UPI0039BD308D